MTQSRSTRLDALSIGMYVRVPLDYERSDNEFRDFRSGQVVKVNEIAAIAVVELYPSILDMRISEKHLEFPLEFIARCQILPASPCYDRVSRCAGIVLCACETNLHPGRYVDYYVQLGGHIQRVSEKQLVVASDRFDPDPHSQLRTYELHNPVWRSNRDAIITASDELRSATWGVEDLVGSRIILLPHQAEVVATVLGDERGRYMLADEVGLGKTVEACVICRGLLRREPDLQVLIIVPAALVAQWRQELDTKFWLNMHQLYPGSVVPEDGRKWHGAIVAAEDLAQDENVWRALRAKKWPLVIIDEAHHCAQSPILYQRLLALSRKARRVLVLTATPIQRRATEYLALLRLMDPDHYNDMSTATFSRLVDAQDILRRTVAYLGPSLTPRDFDPDEFVEEMRPVIDALPTDSVLQKLVQQIVPAAETTRRREAQLVDARAVLAYLGENYRIEQRVIRNRRVSLATDLPQRELDERAFYTPQAVEVEALDALYDYLAIMMRDNDQSELGAAASRVLLHAASSSPHALADLLALRSKPDLVNHRGPEEVDLTRAAAPRNESTRIRRLLSLLPTTPTEAEALHAVLWRVNQWRDATDAALAEVPAMESYVGAAMSPGSVRLVCVLNAVIEELNRRPRRKVIVFSAWPRTLELLIAPLVRTFGRRIVAQFHVGMDDNQLQAAADAFQADDQCAVLLCDELGGEGRNFQIADDIIHVDLPWTPAQLEQRIGRVDRLGRRGKVRSIVAVARGQVDDDLYRIWNEAFTLFTHSMSGLEIALEGIQDELAESIRANTRQGIADIFPSMMRYADELRSQVEEERYFEEQAINRRRRNEFAEIVDHYNDGKRLRAPFLQWAKLAGLAPSDDDFGDVIRFSPRRFNQASMHSAKLFDLPNMEEALRRSRHRHEYVITGTFDRNIAVKREDLVFLAPGGDPWTDAILSNAIEADRGRCCAIGRKSPLIERKWQGFDLLYSVGIDPRPLFEAGFSPAHLHRAQGFLAVTTVRLVMRPNGARVPTSDPIHSVLGIPFDKRTDVHLGKRDLPDAQLAGFKKAYPPDQWETVVDRVVSAARNVLMEELNFTNEAADEADAEFRQHADGMLAALRWRHGDKIPTSAVHEAEDYARISKALVLGLRVPHVRLESVCFWYIEPSVVR